MKNNPHRASSGATGAEVVGQFEQTPYTASCPSQQLGTSHTAWALHYARCGWKVFPLHSIGPDGRCTCGKAHPDGKSAGKHPLSSHGFKDATTDPRTIERWWARWPWANIGIATGKASGGLVVLDPNGAEGMAELIALTEKHRTLPETLTSQTGNGLHILFQGDGIKSSASGKLHVRGENGYIVAPPSKHVNGRLYGWIKFGPIAPLPAWLKGWMQGVAARTANPESASSVFGENVPEYLLKLPRQNVETVQEVLRNLSGSRSANEEARIRSALRSIPADNYETWYKIGMILQWLQWIRSDGSDSGLEIWDEWSETCLGKYPGRSGIEDKRASFSRTNRGELGLGSLFQLAQESGWSETPDLHDVPSVSAVATKEPLTDSSTKTTLTWGSSIVSAAELRTMTFEPVRYVLPGFIVEGVTLLVGRPKVGKSWWVLDLCLGCAAGLITLGKLKAMEGDVLYLALEDGKRRLQKRLDKLLPIFGGEWPERLKLVPMGGWRRADQGGLQDIEEWCKSVSKPILIVVDTLARFRKPQNNKTPLYGSDYEAIAGLQQIATQFQVAIVVLHHDRKSDAEDAFDTVSGTLGLTGAADTILIIKRGANGVVLHARGRDIEESETAMQFDKQTCRWTILGAAADVLQSNERAKIIAALTSAGQALTIKEIMADAETSNRNATDILLGKMVREGQIVRVGRSRYDLSRYHQRKDRTERKIEWPTH